MDPLNPSTQYNVPKSESKYLKFEEGATEFMPLASAIIGWEYWNLDGKPVRVTEKPEEIPVDIRRDQKTGQPETIKHFWAFPVIECATGKVRVLEITQKTIQKAIRDLTTNPRWGSPIQRYTITVKRDDSTTPTTYSIMPNPFESVTPQAWLDEWHRVKQAGFDITRLFRNGDPFTPDANDPAPAPTPAPAPAPVAAQPEAIDPNEPVDNEQPPN